MVAETKTGFRETINCLSAAEYTFAGLFLRLLFVVVSLSESLSSSEPSLSELLTALSFSLSESLNSGSFPLFATLKQEV